MHKLVIVACALAAAGLATAVEAQPAAAPAPAATEYVTIPLETRVNAPADRAWAKIKGYCDIGAWLKTSCAITSGKDGEVGAVRRIANRIDEVLVSSTAWSYTYAQPKSPIDYHGTLEIRPDGPNASKLMYTLVYDAAGLPAGADKAADKARRTTQFTGILQTIKGIAEK